MRASLGLALSLVAISACGPTYMTAGYQPKWSASGPLAPVIAQNNGGEANGNAASLGVGIGNRRVAIETAINTFNVGSGTFDVAPGIVAATLIAEGEGADAGIAGRWATVSTSIDARVTAVRWRRFGVFARVGGATTLVLDKATIGRSWGTGFRYGAGVEVTFRRSAAVVAELTESRLSFDSGVAAGASTLRGATIGIILAR